MAITRETMTDDDGSGTTGTIWNNTKLQAVYDSIETTWALTSYTPTWGNTGTANTTTGSTISGAYFKIGKMVFFQIGLSWGVGTASGSGGWTFTLPVTANTFGISGNVEAHYVDASASQIWRGTGVNNSTTVFQAYSNGNPIAAVLSTVPFTWTNGDACYITGWYLAA